MNYLVNLNLNKNEIQNAVIQPLASAPAGAKAGQIYYNSGDKLIYRYDGTGWGPVGVVYSQGSSAGAVITGLDSAGNVTTTNVTGLTLTGYTPVTGGYISNNMTLEQALAALDTAVKNAVAGGGEVNQNAWSNITVKKQSTGETAVTGAAADTTIAAGAKTDTFAVASGNKWVNVGSDGKQINVGHSLSGVTAGTAGSAAKVPAITVDKAGHITSMEEKAITPAAIGADASGAAAAVLGSASDDSSKNTVYGAKKLAQKGVDDAAAAKTAADGKVASVSAAENKGIEIGGTATDPTVGIKLSNSEDNAATVGADGLMVTIPEVDVPEYTIVKLDTATAGYLASYQLQKDGTGVGPVINIPKDYLVKSAYVKTSTGASDPSGFPSGTKYVDFVINTYDTSSGSGTESHIYLNVQDLMDVFTPGDGIDISDSNVISVKVVAANGLSVGTNGIAMAAASESANGAMTKDMVTKLKGIDAGATSNTITLNGTAAKNPSFYAPAAAGTSGQVLTSNGSGAPTWEKPKVIVEESTGPTSSDFGMGWDYTAPDGYEVATVQVFDTTGTTSEMVMCDITNDGTNVKITMNTDGISIAEGDYIARIVCYII